jgi:unsaturated rhamnogalacturonyl hydrolase
VGGALEVGQGVADQWMSARWAKYLKWDWADAVMLYGMERLGGKYRDYVREYQAKWAKSGLPRIDKADRCPSALSAMSLYRAGDKSALDPAIPVIDFLRNEPRNALGAIDHLGHSFFSHFVPSSVWVDSLMMMGVLATQWGRTMNDQALFDFGVVQPLIYASVLQDQASGLFRHAYFIKSGSSLPASASYWLRGNGWVLVSIAEIMDELPPDSLYAPRLKDIFVKVADGLARYQMADGLWGTIANAPGYAYSESSGTLLASYAIAHAVHRGWLDASYLPMARRAFAGVSAKLWKTKAGYSIPGNSGATNPTPRWVYAKVPQVLDAPYGVGAYLLAAHELRDEVF